MPKNYIPPGKFPDKLHLNVSDQYFDRVQIWFSKRLSDAARTKLASLCRGGLHRRLQPMEFQARYCERLQVRQPTLEAFQFLDAIASEQAVMINGVELACDICPPTWSDAEALKELIDHGWIRRWHRAEQGVRLWEEKTRYDAPRGARNRTVAYLQGHARTTGELNCVHLEWRAQTASVVRGLGIETVQDLIQFDHLAFWQRNLLVYCINEEKLGRMLRNNRLGTRGRASLFVRYSHGFDINVDCRLGRAVVVVNGSVQEVVDNIKHVPVRRSLERVDVVLVS